MRLDDLDAGGREVIASAKITRRYRELKASGAEDGNVSVRHFEGYDYELTFVDGSTQTGHLDEGNPFECRLDRAQDAEFLTIDGEERELANGTESVLARVIPVTLA